MKNRRIALVSLALLAIAQPAYSWNDTGHMAVARIAWMHMTPAARRAAIALLRSAPRDAGLSTLYPGMGTQKERDEMFFMRAATWPDIVRDPNEPIRQKKYHHAPWHFVDQYWKDGANGPVAVTFADQNDENAAERIEQFAQDIEDGDLGAGQRAVELAWLLHLVGDIHQPLHCSSRVTDELPKGDRGGNSVALSHGNLHSYWDHIVDTKLPKQNGEAKEAYVIRVASSIEGIAPRDGLARAIKETRPTVWASVGLRSAQQHAYAPSILEDGDATDAYRDDTFNTAAPSIALAGYRLAELLNHLLG